MILIEVWHGCADLTFGCCTGFSNLATGLAGAGFTGSYIFSQTVFSMRAGVLSRLNGSVVAVLELILFLMPKSVGGSPSQKLVSHDLARLHDPQLGSTYGSL